ncbi:MAG: hypothetical protein GY716_04530 [bacterium]|nr:hypothetical protein [bacterium]
MSLARHRELLILGAVCKHEVHGYALAEALAAGSGFGLGLKRPTIYALLNRLQERGLVTCRTERDSAHPERHVYRATKSGKRALADLVRASAEASVSTMVPLAVIVAHLDELPADDAVAVLEACREELREGLDGLAAIPGHADLAGAALELVRRHLELDLEVVEGLIAGGQPR